MSSPLIWNGSYAKCLPSDILINNSTFTQLALGHEIATLQSTGIENGGVLSINGGDNTKFDLSAGSGTIIDYSIPNVPKIKPIAWNAFTAQTVTNIGTAAGTYILMSPAGSIIQQIAYPTPAQRRANIFIGLLGHATHTVILSANTIPDIDQSIGSQVYDFFDALGPFNIAGNTIVANGANLNINTSGGTMFQRSFGYSTTPQNPSVITITGATPATFAYGTQTTFASTTTTVDPGHYDVAGTVTIVPGPNGTATIQRVYLGANSRVFIAYGQNTYVSLAAAAAAVGTDSFIQNPALTGVTILIGYIVLVKNATTLNNTAQANFLAAPRFASGVGGGSNTILTLQDTYNASVQPQITLASTMGGIQFLDNATPLGASLFQVASSGAATNFLNVLATGVTVNQLIDSGLTANTAIVANASKQLTSSATTDVQVGYLSTSTSDIQAQINTKQGQNLILDPSFESGTVTQWTLGTTGTLTNGIPTGSPTFGSGASGNLSISPQTTGALNGTYSLQYQHVNNQTVAGNMMATNPITIQPEFQAKVMGIKFAYSTTLFPSNGNYSGTSANSFGWALWDISNSAWIGTAGQFNIVQSSGVGICTGTVQLPSNTTSVRFMFYNVTATSATVGGGAITLLLDDFYFGPQVSANAPAMSDPVAYTPSVGGVTGGTVFAQYHREGKYLIVEGYVGSGTSNASVLSIPLPSGLVIDSSVTGTRANTAMLGKWNLMLTATTARSLKTVFFDGSDTSNVYLGDSEAASGNQWSKLTGNAEFGTTVAISIVFEFRVPITGWSSNTVSSADTDTRVVAMSALKGGSSVSHTATSTSQTISTYGTVVRDTSGSFNASTGVYTVGVSGLYLATGTIGYNTNATGIRSGNILQAGSATTNINFGQVTAITAAGTYITGSGVFSCNAGDTLVMQGYQDSGGSLVYQAFNFGVTRISGPAVVQATETVAARYTTTAGNSVAVSTTTFLDFGTKSFDDHNAVLGAGSGNVTTTNTGWRFIVPVSGKYLVNARFSLNIPNATRFLISIGIYVNGVSYAISQPGDFSSGSLTNVGALTATISDEILCNAGDRIEISGFQFNGASSSQAMVTTTGINAVSINRIGN